MKKSLSVLMPAISVFLFFGAYAAEPVDAARAGVRGPAAAGLRGPSMTANISLPSGGGSVAAGAGTSTNVLSGGGGTDGGTVSMKDDGKKPEDNKKPEPKPETEKPKPKPEEPVGDSETCREGYRECMDAFCLMDASEGERCACSNNIEHSKTLIREINEIQAAAEKLFGEGVEREKLGAKAILVFGQSEKARRSGIDFMSWVYGGGDGMSLDSDLDIGSNLYYMAAESCATRLAKCGKDAKMEEMLYERQITADCKAFTSFLNSQKTIAENNKLAAERAVRAARFEMLDQTNRFNRGECLIAYKNCIADKGGCGANFENCLDADLLGRRAFACENILDQCMAVRKYVVEDWAAESVHVLNEAARYADVNKRGTCLARIQACLEDSCTTATNDQCLNNVSIAAGVCPIIDECNALVPGIRASVNDKLGFLRVRFCQSDVDKCLQEKCGSNFGRPECVGKRPTEILAMCPQNLFPSCRGQTQFDIIVSGAMLQMDFQIMQGCINHFSDALGRVCGTDMSCLPADGEVAAMKKSSDVVDWRRNATKEVENFFKQFEKDVTIRACGTGNFGRNVFNTAKLLAQVQAEGRAERAYIARIAELARAEDLDAARKACEKIKSDHKDTDNVWISSVTFEPALRNCHVCRVQKSCEIGGEEKSTSALKAAAGGLSAGASAGTMVSPGWGTAIGAVVGAVGAGALGAASGGTKEFCQEIPSCEDINM